MHAFMTFDGVCMQVERSLGVCHHSKDIEIFRKSVQLFCAIGFSTISKNHTYCNSLVRQLGKHVYMRKYIMNFCLPRASSLF